MGNGEDSVQFLLLDSFIVYRRDHDQKAPPFLTVPLLKWLDQMNGSTQSNTIPWDKTNSSIYYYIQ